MVNSISSKNQNVCNPIMYNIGLYLKLSSRELIVIKTTNQGMNLDAGPYEAFYSVRSE